VRTVLITGGASGMGRAIATRFAEAGDHVVLGDIDAARLADAAGVLGPRVTTRVSDVSRTDECAALVAAAVSAGGGLDVVVNCAGVWVEGPTADASEADFDRTLAVNLKGPFFICSHAIPALVRNAGAAIYSASKGGLVLLTKALALELAPMGVRVNAVCPCDVATPMIEYQATTYGEGDPAAYKARLLARYPQGPLARFATPQEVAELVYYLASPAAAPVTGAAMPIDFGLTAGY
jgi:NAD(P)-dependent dehydrogenase (short-subunit alcohol dehydrogenase family)